MNHLHRASRVVAFAAAFVLPCAAFAGTPYPNAKTADAVDLGAISSTTSSESVTVTLALKMRDPDGAETLLQAMQTPGSRQYGQFLTPEQFRDRFAPTDAQFARLRASLAPFGLTAERATSTTMRVTGSSAAIEKALKVSLRRMYVAGQGRSTGYSFREPSTAYTLPGDTDALVHSIFGLSTRPLYHPNLKRGSATKVSSLARSAAPAVDGGNEPGFWTTVDFARHYNATPLYDAGIKGAGRTIGIVTLAAFTPSDAFAYWRAIGLTVDANRLTVVNIDGGPGAPSDESGSDETTLDVEQSGGVAPAAKIIVYQAPNTDQGFLDAFARAVDNNQADAVSTSWGLWEWFSKKSNSTVTDVYTGRAVSALRAYHEVFLQAALQGQSLFAASGDAGAYDANRQLPPPTFSLILSVDHPASDTLMTAAGGTTLPGKQVYNLGGGKTFVADIKKERVWSWDYLFPLCDLLGEDPISCGVFPVGGGGGVSVFFDRPLYQFGIDGIQKSEPGQKLVEYDVVPAETIYKLPARFAGRNVPDISANADPETGYILYYTSDQDGFGIGAYGGGTSFVAPQMAGVAVLLSQSLKRRVGLLNIPMYEVARSGPYGANGAIQPIRTGNNDFYEGSNGYNPGAGLGILDVSRFSTYLKRNY